MSSTMTPAARTTLLIVASLVLTVLGSGALSVRVHNEREADRRARVEQHRPDATTPLPDPFVDPPRR
ncbi:hypothetical protein [Streptomyces macrosporus]|uniref:Secreted protein n=1 Tax=Streptomyces macrosporus TaxID=44032 RepID=A0ABN3JCJ1_9ACTN